MPVVPHYPSDDERDRREAPDITDIVDRIIDRDDPTPTAACPIRRRVARSVGA